MVYGAVCDSPKVPVLINGRDVLRVSSFELLGSITDKKVQWNNHTELICLKAQQQLPYLDLIVRFGLALDYQFLLHFY